MRRILLSLVFLSSFFLLSVQSNAQNDNALAKQLVSKNAAAIGLSQNDLNNYIVSSSYFNQTAGTEMVYLLQGYKGLPVWNQMLVLAFKDGKMISKAGEFLPNLDQLTGGRPATPSVTAADAVRSAITETNLVMPGSITQRYTPDAGKKIDFGTLGLAKENVTAELMWVPVLNGATMTGVNLAWQVQLYPLINSDYWSIRVDANNKAILDKNNLTVYDVIDQPGNEYLSQNNFLLKDPKSFNKESTTSTSSLNNLFSVTDNTTKKNNNNPSLVTTVNYTVIPYPAEAPSFPNGTAAIRTNPWLLAGGNAVSLGWHNDGAVDYTVSRGNNVRAHEDQANNNSNNGIQAQSTTTPDPLNFTYAGQPNYTVAPTTPGFQQFAITNLFYWNNICHDVTYKYGFDEPAGNFQNNNQGRGGLGGDYVEADAQDGGGLNNANFATPPDGGKPRMQMYLFNPSPGILTFNVNSPASIAGPYVAVEGAMSTNNLLGNVGPRTANLVYYNDNAGGTHEACVPPSNGAALVGKIALINRGNCTFVLKVHAAQDAGAIAVVMVNNVPGNPIVMGGADNTIIIPAIMISDVDGATIAAQLNNPFVNVTMSATGAGTVNLDGDIDNGVVNHEFFHGVSNRLTGGPATTSCLGNAEEGGEGWSDYNALMLGTDWATAVAADGFNKKRPIGTYVLGQAPTGNGIRLYPYCTNINVNPLTYASMGVPPVGTEVHNIGEIWCMALWEMTWGLIQTDGINPNLFNNAAAGGNSVAYKLVIEGLKLQPCSPGYIDARNAILQADQNLYGGAHYCAIYAAFAKRGMGFGASQGSSNSATDQTPSFALPPGATFTTQPSNTTTCNGSTVSFTATATNATAYQWQVSTTGCGGTFTNIPVGAPYSGTTTNTLTINPAAVSMNGYAYRLVATTLCGTGNSNCAVLTVVASAVGGTITPANTNVCSVPNSTLLTLSGNVGPVSEWDQSTVSAAGPFTAIAGTAGAQTYTATNIAQTTWYRVLISASGCASANSSVASVTVLPGALPMFIVADPGTTVCAGDPTRLTVMEGASTNGTLYTQTGAASNGAPSQNFETAFDAFDCQGADDFTVPANTTWTVNQVNVTGTLSTTGPPASFNVIFYNNSAALPGSVVQTFNNVATFTGAAGSYNITLPAGLPLTAGTYWVSVQVNMNFTPAGQWFWSNFGGANVGNASAWQNPGGGFGVGCTSWGNSCAVGGNNRNHIFTIIGSSITAPTVVTGGTFLWSPAAGLSSTTTNPVAASPAVTTTYTVQHNNGLGCIRTAQITINVNTRPTVTTNPSSTSVCNGSTATFTAAGTGTGLTYQWQFSTNNGATWNNVPAAAPYSGTQTATLTINPVTAAMNGYRYRMVLGGACPPGLGTPNISTGATLTVVPLPTVSITPAGPLCGGVAGVFGVSLSTGAVVLPPVPGSVTVNSGTINVAIPEGVFPNPPATAGTSTLAVSGIPANATITNISVKSNITHAYVGDVVMVLKAANGAILNLDALLNKTNNAGANFVNTIISSSGVTTLNNGAAPFTGTFKADAVGATFVFAGFTLAGGPVGYTPTTQVWNTLYPSPNGNWTLAMYDAGPPDVGNLTSWEIKIDYTTPAPGSPISYIWTPAAGLYTDPNATVAYVPGASVGTVYAAPTATTTYTVTANDGTTGCSNTASVLVYSTPPAPTVTPNPVSMCLGDPPVRLISASAVPGTCSVNSGAINIAIPDANPTNTQNFTVTSTQAVNCIPANATITGIAVTLSIPAHTYVADLSFNLKSPGGTVINLFRNLGGTGGTNTTYPNTGIVNLTLSSASNVSLATANTPAVGTLTGTYKADIRNSASTPFYTLSDPPGYPSTATSWAPMFANTAGAANGTWTLALTDDGNGDIGSLTNWSMKFDYVIGVQSSQAMWSPATFLWLDQGATIPYVAGTQHDTVFTRPTPAGVYTYNVTVNSVPPPSPVTVTTPMAGGNGNNMVFFNLQNTTGTDYTLKSISTNAFSSGTVPTVNLWMKTTAPIAGNPGSISTGNGWNIVGTASNVAVTANSLNQVIANMNIVIPAGANYGIGLEFTPAGGVVPAYTNGTGAVQTYTNNGINIITDGNVGWGGPVAPGPPANNPRNFNGAVTLTAQGGLCTSPARVVTVTVNNPVVITTQPVNQSVCTNGTISFTVAATGTGLTYQWQVSTNGGTTFTNITNGGVYSGATTSTLTITNPPVSMNGYIYRVVVSGTSPCPSVPSLNRILTVNPLPTVLIVASPYQNLFPGLTTTINATSSPAAVTYTWFRNGAVIPNATTGSYVADIDHLGQYRVRVTDVNGCTNFSNTITIGDSLSGRVFIYPNPTGGRFQVRYNPMHNIVSPFGVNIYDAMGKRILTQTYTLGVPYAPMYVDLSNHGSGIFWVEVVDVDGQRLAMGRVDIVR